MVTRRSPATSSLRPVTVMRRLRLEDGSKTRTGGSTRTADGSRGVATSDTRPAGVSVRSTV